MTPNLDKIVEHYHHAREKHPYFADIINTSMETRCVSYHNLMMWHNMRKIQLVKSSVDINTILMEKICELFDAISNGNTPAAIEEAYDCIAVLLRIIDVLEGRQKLGKPEEVKE